MEAGAQLVGVVVVVDPALASENDAGGGHAREAGHSEELPGHLHAA